MNMIEVYIFFVLLTCAIGISVLYQRPSIVFFVKEQVVKHKKERPSVTEIIPETPETKENARTKLTRAEVLAEISEARRKEQTSLAA